MWFYKTVAHPVYNQNCTVVVWLLSFQSVAHLLWMTKWRRVASICMGLPENRQLVWVLSLRAISGECNTRWFMLFFHIWIIIVLFWWKLESQKRADLPILATCRSGTLEMLSSKVNQFCCSWKHMTDIRHRGHWLVKRRHFEHVICALLMWPPFLWDHLYLIHTIVCHDTAPLLAIAY